MVLPNISYYRQRMPRFDFKVAFISCILAQVLGLKQNKSLKIIIHYGLNQMKIIVVKKLQN